MKTINRFWIMALAFALLAQAAPTQSVELRGLNDWKDGKSEGASLDNEGVLRRGYAFEKIAELPARVLWEGSVDSDGNFYAASTQPSALWKMTPSGKVEKLGETDSKLMRGLALDEKGNLYAGSDEGRIFRADKKGVELFAKLEASYVWAIAYEGSPKRLWVATGLPAVLWNVSLQGKAEKILELPQNHMTALTLAEDGRIFMGSASPATVYERSKEGKTRVVFQSTAAEVRAMAMMDGELFILTYGEVAGGASKPSKEEKPSEENSAPMGSSALYRIDKAGVARKIWDGASESLLTLKAEKGRLLLGGAKQGRLWSLTREGEATALGQLGEGGDLVGIYPSQKSGYILLTNRPSGLFKAQVAQEAEFISDAIGFDTPATFGAMLAEGEGTFVLSARSGFTEKPDDFWSEWLPLKEGKIVAPAAPFLQIKVALKDNASLKSAKVFYSQTPEPLKIDRIRVLPMAFNLQKNEATPSQPIPLEAALVVKLNSTPSNAQFNYQLIADETQKGVQTILWKAIDPLKRELKYTLEVNPEASSEWLKLLSEAIEPFYAFNTLGYPEGRYLARVSAEVVEGGQSESASEVSSVFTIDNTPPALSALKVAVEEGYMKFSIRAQDAWLRLSGGSATLEGQRSIDLVPTDGLWDGSGETLEGSFKLEGLGGQKLTLSIEVWDENGNSAILTSTVKR